MLMTALLGLLVPAMVALAVVLVAIRWKGVERGAAPSSAIGLGCGYAAGQVAIVGWTGLWPVDATYRLAHLALLAALIGALSGVWRNRVAARWISLIVPAVMLPFVLLQTVMEYRWEGMADLLGPAGVIVAVVAFGWILERQAATLGGVTVPFLLVILCTAGSVTLVVSHSAYLGQMGGVLAAGLGAIGILMYFRPAMRLAPGGTAVVTTVLSGLWICGYFFASMPAASALALGLAPWSAALGGIGPLARRSDWQVLALRSFLLLIPAGWAIWYALSANSSTGAGDLGY